MPCASVLSSMALDAALIHQSLRHALADMHASARTLADRLRDAQPAVARRLLQCDPHVAAAEGTRGGHDGRAGGAGAAVQQDL